MQYCNCEVRRLLWKKSTGKLFQQNEFSLAYPVDSTEYDSVSLVQGFDLIKKKKKKKKPHTNATQTQQVYDWFPR